jgi:hypothetical protein
MSRNPIVDKFPHMFFYAGRRPAHQAKDTMTYLSPVGVRLCWDLNPIETLWVALKLGTGYYPCLTSSPAENEVNKVIDNISKNIDFLVRTSSVVFIVRDARWRLHPERPCEKIGSGTSIQKKCRVFFDSRRRRDSIHAMLL